MSLGDEETRILALERKAIHLPGLLQLLEGRLIASEQAATGAWEASGIRPPTNRVTLTGGAAASCPGMTYPFTLDVTSSRMAGVHYSLNWDAGSGLWLGCGFYKDSTSGYPVYANCTGVIHNVANLSPWVMQLTTDLKLSLYSNICQAGTLQAGQMMTGSCPGTLTGSAPFGAANTYTHFSASAFDSLNCGSPFAALWSRLLFGVSNDSFTIQP
jgi:hypothetical protein